MTSHHFWPVAITASLSFAIVAQSAAPAPAASPAALPAKISPDSVPSCSSPVPPPITPEQLAAYRVPRATPRPPLPPAATAVPIRADAMRKHDCFLAVATRGQIDLMFVGDSITDFFGRADRGQATWNRYYGAMRAANFGVSGDTTQDVLWRMRNGELEGFRAKVIVLMLGTNNLKRNANTDIAAGDAAIVAEFRKRQPQAKILVLGVFPRGKDANGDARIAIREINDGLAKLADDKSIFFLDIGSVFLNPDGTLIDGMTVDELHPSPQGYEAWAAAIDPMLKKLMR